MERAVYIWNLHRHDDIEVGGACVRWLCRKCSVQLWYAYHLGRHSIEGRVCTETQFSEGRKTRIIVWCVFWYTWHVTRGVCLFISGEWMTWIRHYKMIESSSCNRSSPNHHDTTPSICWSHHSCSWSMIPDHGMNKPPWRIVYRKIWYQHISMNHIILRSYFYETDSVLNYLCRVRNSPQISVTAKVLYNQPWYLYVYTALPQSTTHHDIMYRHLQRVYGDLFQSRHRRDTHWHSTPHHIFCSL